MSKKQRKNQKQKKSANKHRYIPKDADDPVCLSCGKNRFILWRSADYQMVAECLHCHRPHLLQTNTNKLKGEKDLDFWSPELLEYP